MKDWHDPLFQGFELCMAVRIKGDPHGKESVRVFDGIGRKAKKTKNYENLVLVLARHQVILPFKAPIRGPLILRVLSVKRRPEKVDAFLELPDGRALCPVTPDWDNIGKSVSDGPQKRRGKGQGVYSNDSAIVDARVRKLYGKAGEDPFVDIALFARLDLQ